MKEMGLSRPKVDVARVAETDLWRWPPPAPCRVSGPQARSTTTAGGKARVTVTCPVDDVHQARLTGA